MNFLSSIKVAVLFSLSSLAIAQSGTDISQAKLDGYVEQVDYSINNPESFSESIDEFSGGLSISHNDLTIPGPGGFDLSIMRRYFTPPLFTPGTATLQKPIGTPMGDGWSINFGYISGSSDNNISRDTSKSLITQCSFGQYVEHEYFEFQNLSIVTADGNREYLLNSMNDDYSFHTKSGWRGGCANTGYIMYSPEGVSYEFNVLKIGSTVQYSNVNRNSAWYVSRMEDKFGNWISINYRADEEARIDSITSSDGREINFEYTTINGYLTLTAIESSGQSINYHYDSRRLLSSVTLGNRTLWKYKYHDYLNRGESFPLSQLETESGGIINYEGHGGTAVGTYSLHWRTSRRSTSGTLPSGETTYTRLTRDTSFSQFETIEIRDGESCTKALYYTYISAVNQRSNALWREQKPYQRDVYAGNNCEGEVRESTRYTWKRIPFSAQSIRRGHALGDVDGYGYVSGSATNTVMESRIIKRDGINYVTEYGDYTMYGKPLLVTEYSVNDTSSYELTRRTTEYQYTNSPYRLGLEYLKSRYIKSSTGHVVDNYVANFDNFFNVISEVTNGIANNYNFYSNGNLESETDARGNKTRYLAHYRGQPRTIADAVGAKFYEIDYFGNITSETNELSNVTLFSYTDFDRLISIKPPLGSTISYAYGNDFYKITYGKLEVRADVDGFFRPLLMTQTDLNTGVKKYTNYEYDYEERKIFESILSDSPYESVGTSTEYDLLDRVTREVNPLGDRIINYLDNAKIQYTNVRGFVSTYEYESYGEPNYGNIVQMADPSSTGTIITTIDKDEVGRILSVSQGGESPASQKTTTYVYHNSYLDLPVSIEIPQFTSTYEYDSVGNRISSRISNGPTTTYSYDSRNRRTLINYPDATPDVRYNYNKVDNLISALNGDGDWYFDYDANETLIERKLSTLGRNYLFKYRYNSQNDLEGIDYLYSGVSVDYAPDAFGNATRAGQFASLVSYHPIGSLKQFTYANGIVYKTQLASNKVLLNKIQGNLLGGISVIEKNYVFDAHGNATNIVDVVNPRNNVNNISYDGIDRLISAESNSFGGKIDFTYDTRGNILKKSFPDRDLDYVYDSSDFLTRIDTKPKASSGWVLIGVGNILTPIPFQISESSQNFEYDYRGNVINNSRHSLGFNEANQLKISSNTDDVIYKYDAFGRRVQVVHSDGSVNYEVYDDSDRLLLTESDFKVTSKVYLGNNLIANHTKDSVKYIHFDLIGSTVGISDEVANIQYEDYLPFGKRLDNPSGTGNDQWYTGKKYDERLALSYHGARYYDPAVSRFYSNDPVDYLGHLNRNNPVHGFGRYSYANNNPYKYVDPNGEFGLLGALVGAAVEAGIQLATDGKITDLKAIGVAGAVGFVTGGVGGRLATQAIKGTISASKAVKTTAAVGGAANGVGTVTSNAIDGEATTVTEAAIAVVGGAAGAGAGAKIANKVASKLDNLASSSNLGQGISDATRSSFGGGAEAGSSFGEVAGSAAVEATSNLAQKELNKHL